jgi:hypothetical protein
MKLKKACIRDKEANLMSKCLFKYYLLFDELGLRDFMNGFSIIHDHMSSFLAYLPENKIAFDVGTEIRNNICKLAEIKQPRERSS